MNAPVRRGACPSLSTPMATGDGLLVRLSPLEGGLTPAQLAGLSAAAKRYGNGMMEVSARGSLQIRGLDSASVGDLTQAVDRLGIAVREGVPVETGPLAGRDPDEVADPRDLVAKIRHRIVEGKLSGRLAPKVSVIVDGGGRLPLDGIIADIRLAAMATGRWQIAIGGTTTTARPVATVDEARAAQLVLALLEAIAMKGRTARGRDLAAADLVALGICLPRGPSEPQHVPMTGVSHPVGILALKPTGFALGIALPFGQIRADDMSAMADSAGKVGAKEIRLAPGRGLLFLPAGESVLAVDDLREAANRLDFVTDKDDPRLAIVACAGQPACAAGNVATRTVGAGVAKATPHLLDGSFRLHLSGCEKRCAAPTGAAWVLVGGRDGSCALFDESDGASTAIADVAPDEAAAAFARLDAAFARHGKTGERAAAFLARQDRAEIASLLRGDPQ
ncbi:precorrin-3B synthase [Nitratireductor mangrovi]|uniref:Precorrin-3B synthase n=1 Tax=Nitratireductor mangrovi TaxID=2599600 RepID=A0A5B8L187_9HYPH|nr:precorrin-3B synthase [Nitratireductor mangrovi]QDZ01619.1 precorrin-3B synthase [Nitratireductor mangrovi]